LLISCAWISEIQNVQTYRTQEHLIQLDTIIIPWYHILNQCEVPDNYLINL